MTYELTVAKMIGNVTHETDFKIFYGFLNAHRVFTLRRWSCCDFLGDFFFGKKRSQGSHYLLHRLRATSDSRTCMGVHIFLVELNARASLIIRAQLYKNMRSTTLYYCLSQAFFVFISMSPAFTCRCSPSVA